MRRAKIHVNPVLHLLKTDGATLAGECWHVFFGSVWDRRHHRTFEAAWAVVTAYVDSGGVLPELPETIGTSPSKAVRAQNAAVRDAWADFFGRELEDDEEFT